MIDKIQIWETLENNQKFYCKSDRLGILFAHPSSNHGNLMVESVAMVEIINHRAPNHELFCIVTITLSSGIVHDRYWMRGYMFKDFVETFVIKQN